MALSQEKMQKKLSLLLKTSWKREQRKKRSPVGILFPSAVCGFYETFMKRQKVSFGLAVGELKIFRLTKVYGNGVFC